jgi:uncharacterized protein YdhG (YjbR/CyaY superfamily)
VSAQEIDQYLDALEEPKRAALARLRQTILEILPEADRGISYGVPAFKVRGKAIAGFAAFKNHLSYLPHSGSVFPQLHDELQGYATSPVRGLHSLVRRLAVLACVEVSVSNQSSNAACRVVQEAPRATRPAS